MRYYDLFCKLIKSFLIGVSILPMCFFIIMAFSAYLFDVNLLTSAASFSGYMVNAVPEGYMITKEDINALLQIENALNLVVFYSFLIGTFFSSISLLNVFYLRYKAYKIKNNIV